MNPLNLMKRIVLELGERINNELQFEQVDIEEAVLTNLFPDKKQNRRKN